MSDSEGGLIDEGFEGRRAVEAKERKKGERGGKTKGRSQLTRSTRTSVML